MNLAFVCVLIALYAAKIYGQGQPSFKDIGTLDFSTLKGDAPAEKASSAALVQFRSGYGGGGFGGGSRGGCNGFDIQNRFDFPDYSFIPNLRFDRPCEEGRSCVRRSRSMRCFFHPTHGPLYVVRTADDNVLRIPECKRSRECCRRDGGRSGSCRKKNCQVPVLVYSAIRNSFLFCRINVPICHCGHASKSCRNDRLDFNCVGADCWYPARRGGSRFDDENEFEDDFQDRWRGRGK